MTTIRIRGMYAVALTQLFRQAPGSWDIVQPGEEVRSCINFDWRMDSPVVDIDDVPDEGGHREVIRIAGSADAVSKVLLALQPCLFDMVTHQDTLQVGAIYMGLIGILSRLRRRAVVYLGERLVGVLPLRYADRDLQVGAYVPVRIAALPSEGDDRPELSTSLTVPGQYAVLTSAKAVRMSRQITESHQQERLQRLGEQQDTDGWGIIWRTAAQQADDQMLKAEIQHLKQEAHTLRERLQATTTIGYVRGGEVVVQVYLPGQAKASCDTLRAQCLPTLPGHHKYKAQGDAYAAMVEALEKELPSEVLRSRTANLSALASLNAMRQPIQHRIRILVRDLHGSLHEHAIGQRIAYDLQAGWVEVRQTLRHKHAYPPDFRLDKQPGDYTITRFQEGSWCYTTHFYDRQGTWKGAYAAFTTPLAIFADQLQLLDLHVAVMHSPKHKPELRGMEMLQSKHAHGLITAELVDKIRQEAEGILRHFRQEES